MKWVYYAVQIGITVLMTRGLYYGPSGDAALTPLSIFVCFIFSIFPTALIYWAVEFFRWLWGKWTGAPYEVVPINDGVPVGLAAYYGPKAKRLNPPTSKPDYQGSERIDPPKIRDERR